MIRNFKIVKVDYKYCDYLRQFDNKVPYNAGSKELRPFIGILFVVNGCEYFAPLSSPKAKHMNMKNNIDLVKIDRGKLGVINFNNMIPVKPNNYELFDLNSKPNNIPELKRQLLLKNQLLWLNKNIKPVKGKAIKLYDKYKNDKLPDSLNENDTIKMYKKGKIEMYKIVHEINPNLSTSFLLYSYCRIGGENKMENLKGAIVCLKTTNIKPNFSALAREYGVDRRTAKKMYNGETNQRKGKSKSSKLDKHFDLIKTKLSIPGTNKKAVYEYIVMNVDDDIGTYSNFKKYVAKHEDILIPKKVDVHPRFETEYGKQLQFDWKGPITLHYRNGEEFNFYIFSTTLSASRMHTYEVSEVMTRETVERCLINCFIKLGGVPKEILTDNMSSIVNYSEHKFVNEFVTFCKDFGTIPKKCKVRKCQTKGKVENCNKFVAWLIPYDGEFSTTEELKNIMNKINNKINLEINQTTNMPPISLFNIEKEYLLPLPKQEIIDYYMDNMIAVKVSNESLVYYKGTKYSVPPKYINQTVKLQVIDNKLLIYYNTNLIATHEISNQKIQYDENHYIMALKTTMPYKDDEAIEKLAKKNLDLLSRLTK